MRKIFISVLMFLIFGINSIAQQISLTGKVINPDEKPVKKVLVYLANNPSVYCYSDTLGNFSLTNISTSVSEVMQDKIISFENRKLSVYANNQSIAVDVFTIDGRQVKNIVNMRYCLGTFGLYPEAYLSELPKAIYIVRVIVGNTVQSFKIQNLIPTAFPQGITEYDINNIIDTYITESKSESNIETKSETLDTLVFVHDIYKSRKIPIVSYSIQYDTIHLNNLADYSIAESFEPSVKHFYGGYGNYTDIFSADSVQFIIDYDTLSILEDVLKVITIPVDKIETLDNSIKLISGLHLEPSGTRLFQSARVSVLLKDTVPKDLVVFTHNAQGETYFIPYKKLLDDSCSIFFYIHHFSDIGIGTSEAHPPTDNPEEFTTSDQFLSYIDEYLRYSEFIGELFKPPIELFTVWYNNVVVPMISSIISMEDFLKALDEFLLIAETGAQFGLFSSFTNLPFWDSARELFSDEMMKIWNACVAEYNGLEDNCLKRAVLDIALQILKLNAVVGGTFAPDLTFSSLHALGNGEALNLVSDIEFPTPVKHLETGESYVVQYTLKSPSGNPLPEVVSWSSSRTSVATVDSYGKVTAKSKGEAIIEGKICDIENTFKVIVDGPNCELNYCYNDSCYTGTYWGTGTLPTYNKFGYSNDCQYYNVTDRIELIVDLTSKKPSYFYSNWFVAHSVPDYSSEVPNTCSLHYYSMRNPMFLYYSTWADEIAMVCVGVNNFNGGRGAMDEGYYEFNGRLEENSLIIDVIRCLITPFHRTLTTRIICERID